MWPVLGRFFFLSAFRCVIWNSSNRRRITAILGEETPSLQHTPRRLAALLYASTHDANEWG